MKKATYGQKIVLYSTYENKKTHHNPAQSNKNKRIQKNHVRTHPKNLSTIKKKKQKNKTCRKDRRDGKNRRVTRQKQKETKKTHTHTPQKSVNNKKPKQQLAGRTDRRRG